MDRLISIHLYAEPTAATLDLEETARYVKEVVPSFEVEVRDGFVPYFLGKLPEEQREPAVARLAQGFATAKVRNLLRQDFSFEPLYGEISYEVRRLSDPRSKAAGILYDGFRMMHLFARMIPAPERNLSHIHIVFTNQLPGTWNENDRRYHARVCVFGFPAIISTGGMVEAPAKPREYYLLKHQYSAMGMADAAAVKLDADFRGRFIDYDDERLTEVVKGYVMQAIFHQLTGEGFCEERNCRLYNAHWQEEVIQAQLGSGRFCAQHQDILEKWREAGYEG